MLVNPFTLHNCSITQTSFHLKMFFGVLMCSTYSVFIVKDHLSLFYEAAVQCLPIVSIERIFWRSVVLLMVQRLCAENSVRSVTTIRSQWRITSAAPIAWPQRRVVSPELALFLALCELLCFFLSLAWVPADIDHLDFSLLDLNIIYMLYYSQIHSFSIHVCIF